MTKEAGIDNGEKIVSSISDAGKTEQLHIRGWDYMFSYLIQK